MDTSQNLPGYLDQHFRKRIDIYPEKCSYFSGYVQTQRLTVEKYIRLPTYLHTCKRGLNEKHSIRKRWQTKNSKTRKLSRNATKGLKQVTDIQNNTHLNHNTHLKTLFQVSLTLNRNFLVNNQKITDPYLASCKGEVRTQKCIALDTSDFFKSFLWLSVFGLLVVI